MLKLIERLGPIDESAASDTLTLPFEARMRGRLKAVSGTVLPHAATRPMPSFELPVAGVKF